jgi:hypothetical protein
MKDCIRRPSPPARTMGQMLELRLILHFLVWAAVDCLRPESILVGSSRGGNEPFVPRRRTGGPLRLGTG